MTLTILGPLVLATNLLLLLGGEVIGDVEGFADLFRRLALDHVGDGLAANIKKGLDVKIVGSLENTSAMTLSTFASGCTHKDDLEEHLLIDLHELLVPLLNIGGLLAGIGVVIVGSWGVVLMMLAPLNDLLQDGLIDLVKRQSAI